jgi:hypothetical protein
VSDALRDVLEGGLLQHALERGLPGEHDAEHEARVVVEVGVDAQCAGSRYARGVVPRSMRVQSASMM